RSWVNAVRSTPEGRISLLAQLSAIKSSFLCKSHFSPSDYVGNSFKLLPNAVPFCEVYCPSTRISRSSYQTTGKGGLISTREYQALHPDTLKKKPYACLTCGMQFDVNAWLSVHLAGNPEHIGNRIITSIDPSDDRAECYLCFDRMDKFHSTPANPSERIEFLKRIILLGPIDKNRVEELKFNEYPAKFCQKHLATRMLPKTSKVLNYSSGLGKMRYETAQKAKKVLSQRDRMNLRFKRLTNPNSASFERVKVNHLPKMKEVEVFTKSTEFKIGYGAVKDTQVDHAQTKHRFCDLCGEFVDQYMLSPVYPRAYKFFTKLVDLTAQQRAKTWVFINTNVRATICSQHVKPASATVSDSTTSIICDHSSYEELTDK
ncbi:hypothetical protein PMAYCL1PPCAC_27891, partial [Pristionchus mayeri]